MVLAAGDITKRDLILWEYTFEECVPYLEYKLKDVSFRDGVRHFLGIKDTNTDSTPLQKAYCSACKRSGKANCGTCSKVFEVIDERQ